VSFIDHILLFNILCCIRIQDRYASEFSAFKPDKKLHWLPYLGTVSLKLELQDRAIEANVPPLEAALIGLFEQKGQLPFEIIHDHSVTYVWPDVWSVNGLLSSVGSSVDRTSVIRALNTWIDLGVLKEGDNDEYTLLEVIEEGAQPSTSRLGEH
jgi:anaphase-promoting complex subunit 2